MSTDNPSPSGTLNRSSTVTVQEQIRAISNGGELKSTFEGILQTCPRIRILLLGKSGVGKSSLINGIFGETLVKVSHENKPGEANINDEICIRNKDQIILHDSKGFSAGTNDSENFDIVKQFIESRCEVHSAERLHAIWACFQLQGDGPDGGALIEKCDQEILQFADRKGVPIIIVFTKFDDLIKSKQLDAARKKTGVKVTPESVTEQFRLQYKTQLQSIDKYEHAFVSTKPGYTDSLVHLIRLTEQKLSPHQGSYTAEASSTGPATDIEQKIRIVWASVQCLDNDSKIDACIQVGRKKYWSGLTTNLKFPGHGLPEFLKVVHRDIVDNWGFQDPNKLLASHSLSNRMDQFMTDLLKEPSTSMDPPEAARASSSNVANVMTGVFAAGPGMAFLHWARNTLDTTPSTLRAIMGYIVDLTLVMERLAWCIQQQAATEAVNIKRQKLATVIVNKALVELAFDGYSRSEQLTAAHAAIWEFSSLENAFRPELVVATISKLIQDHRYQPQEGTVEALAMREVKQKGISAKAHL